MSINKITPEQYQQFLQSHNQTHFLRNYKWAEFRKFINWEHEIIGYFENDECYAAALILFKSANKTPFKVAYSTRGYVLAPGCSEKDFINELKQYLKGKGAFVYKIDPDIIYTQLDGKLNRTGECDLESYKRFESLGFKHLGFLNNFEGLQPRHTIRINTREKTEQIYANMDSRTRNRTKTGLSLGLEIEFVGSEKLDTFLNILHTTSQRNEFSIRNDDYFREMYSIFADKLILALAKVNFKKALNVIEDEQSALEKELAEINLVLANDEISAKALKKNTNRKKIIEEKSTRNHGIISELEVGLEKYPDGQYIAGTLSIVDYDKCWYLYGGTLSEYRYMFPSYALLGSMIDYCITNNFEYFDLFGIGGDFDESNHYFGIYKFKRGFGGTPIEFIGEFELPLKKIQYLGYTKLYPMLRKIRN